LGVILPQPPGVPVLNGLACLRHTHLTANESPRPHLTITMRCVKSPASGGCEPPEFTRTPRGCLGLLEGFTPPLAEVVLSLQFVPHGDAASGGLPHAFTAPSWLRRKAGPSDVSIMHPPRSGAQPAFATTGAVK